MSDLARRTFIPSAAAASRCICIALTCLALLGCNTFRINVAHPALRGESVLVLPLSEPEAESGPADYSFWGRTGAQGSGPMVARELAAALKEVAGLRPVRLDAFRNALKSAAVSMEELRKGIPDAGALAIGRAAGAHYLVVGRVEDYETTWLLFIPRARVSFQVRCLETTSGRVLWRASWSGASIIRNEGDLARGAARRIAALVSSRRPAP